MTAADDARFWNKTAERYAASKIADPGGYERTLERTRSFLQPNHRVLELGCGTGTTALRLAGSVGSYLATDISERMIGIARQKLDEDPVPCLSFRPAVAEDLADDDHRFDIILAYNYLHLVRDPDATLRTIARLLKPQGVFISKTPCLGEMNVLIRRVLLPAMRSVGKAPHVAIFGARELTQMIVGKGLDIVAHENHATKGSETRPFIVAKNREPEQFVDEDRQ
ncbi:class I SAM-dependent methyltransferase [Devosia alba]|uniref:class I SAM-dependent methyltransferase n=1 Tax=Devosia alba TaxID=3152360 RepID=UPI0032675AEA